MRAFVSSCVVIAVVASAVMAAPPNLLARGKEHYRAGRYVDAIDDLRASAAAALTPEARQAYVATGKLDTLAELEESLIYLALAYDRIGRDAEARDAVTRLLNAERISPTYAKLPLSSDAAEFEPLAVRLVPSVPLTPNPGLAAHKAAPVVAQSGGIVVQPTLAQQRADMVNLIEERVAAARAEIEKSANARIAEAQRQADELIAREREVAQKKADERVAAELASAARAAEEKIAAERAAVERATETKIAAERAAVERETATKIAAERMALQRDTDAKIAAARADAAKAADQKLAAERAAIERETATKIAATRADVEKAAAQKIAAERAVMQRDTDSKIAAARADAAKAADQKLAAERTAIERETTTKIAAARADVEKAAEQKIAAERAAMQKLSEERIAVERASAEAAAQERIAAAEGERRRALLASLRQAETFAIAGQLEDANRIYTALAQSPTSTREAISAAAAGLYRTGAFAEAVRSFTRLGAFARGEDDLRYYYAVSLFEIGKYAEAKTELAAALPNLQRTEDVERYRAKIEQSGPQAAIRR